MAVGVDEPGIHRGALHVLHGLAAVGVQDLVLFADGQNLAVANGHGLRLGTRTIQTDNVGIANHEVHRLFGPVDIRQEEGQRREGDAMRLMRVLVYKWCALACAVGMMTMSLMHT